MKVYSRKRVFLLSIIAEHSGGIVIQACYFCLELGFPLSEAGEESSGDRAPDLEVVLS